jgi:alkylation response protein AidB-like acyl-CoA dehydrogenase
MDLTLSDEQRLLRESVDRFIAATYDTGYRRRVAGDPLGFSPEVWKQFAHLGWLALPIPEAYGGLGAGAVETGILMEAFGRGLVTEPYLATVVIGAGLILECGSEAQQQAILPRGRRRFLISGVRAFGTRGAIRSRPCRDHGEANAGRLARRWPQDRCDRWPCRRPDHRLGPDDER